MNQPVHPARRSERDTSARSHDPDARRPLTSLFIFGLATTLAINPVVLYLLTGRTAVAAFTSLVAVVLVVTLASWRRLTVVTLVLFNSIVLLSAAVHAELILRVLFPEHVVPNLYAIRDGYYVNQPLLAQRFTTAEYSASYHTNVQGFRIAPEQSPQERIATADWLVMGDSFTQGAQVDFTKMYSTLLYRRFPDRIIVNAGISGLGLGQEFNFFLAEGRHLKPSLVILQLGSFNDFMNVEAPSAGPTEHLMAVSALARLVFAPKTDGEDLPLGRWTEPFQPSLQANRDFNVFFNETSGRKQEDLDAFADRLRAFSESVREGGGRLVVVLLPTREQVQSRSLDEVLSAYSIPSSAVDMSRPNRILSELTRDLGIGFVDLLPVFLSAGEGLFFDQDVHLTERGHEVFANGLGDYLETTEGRAGATLLSETGTPERYPSFYRDGGQIVFQGVRDGASDLVTANTELKSRRWLTSTGVDEAHPSFSRDGSAVVFTSGAARTLRTNVILMTLATGTTKSLTPESATFGAIPSFSHTGRQVAFAEWHFDTALQAFTHPRIAVLDLTSSRKTYLTDGHRESWRPVFSPTDTQLAFIEQSEGQFDLQLLDLTTGIRSRLSDTTHNEWDPQFTPDGRSLVYAANPDGNWDLFRLELPTRKTTRITKTRGDEWDPAVSPDGHRLLYGGRFGSFHGILELNLWS